MGSEAAQPPVSVVAELDWRAVDRHLALEYRRRIRSWWRALLIPPPSQPEPLPPAEPVEPLPLVSQLMDTHRVPARAVAGLTAGTTTLTHR